MHMSNLLFFSLDIHNLDFFSQSLTPLTMLSAFSLQN
jgi:hypothetical protein